MGILFECLLWNLLALAGAVFAFVTWYLNSNFDYWKKRGVHFLKPEPYFGNTRATLTFKKHMAEDIQDIYNQLEGHKFAGAFRMRFPFLLIRDPELIKHVMVKDFQHFQGRGMKINPKVNPLGQHLFAISGPIWRILRTKLTPTFTTGKMKLMFQLMEECSVQLGEYLREHAENSEVLEMKEVLAKFTTDVIGTCAFGLQFNSLADENSEFRRMGRKIFTRNMLSVLKRMLIFQVPPIAKLLKLSLLDQDVTDFFLNLVKDTVEYREKNNIKRNDFIQQLIQLKNQGRVDDGDEENSKDEETEDHHTTHYENFELTDSLMASQLFVFFIAGFETSSTTMGFTLYELALNPDIQSRLREEVDSTLEECEGKITYDALLKMDYLDRVIAETLRMYPAVPNLVRAVTIPYKIPDTDITIDKGMQTIIPVFAIHRDPKYYPNPTKFDPERFTAENRAKRPHFTYLPFGEGPRNCIGMRFGLMQSKLGILSLISKYEFSVCEDTPIPIKLDSKAPVTSSTNGIILRISKRR